MTHTEIAQVLFGYLRDMVYDPQHADFSTAQSLPEEYKDVVTACQQICKWNAENSEFAKNLGNGELNATAPGRENIQAQALKLLQSNLKHLTWQSQQVAKGDYGQKLDFMGDFSDAFNTMVIQLEERESKLLTNLKTIEQKNIELKRSQDFFNKVANNIPRIVVVLDEQGEVLFENHVARSLRKNDPAHARRLVQRLHTIKKPHSEIHFGDESFMHWYDVERNVFFAEEHSESVYVVEDITFLKDQVEAIENLAYTDELTGVSNRYYGMQKLNDLVNERRPFCVAFVDLDDLRFVNDSFGHKEGDSYIKLIAAALKLIPKLITLARIGGDEFMLLVATESVTVLNQQLEDIRNCVLEGKAEKEAAYQTTFSYGVVLSRDCWDSSLLLRQADELMYRYKFAHKKEL